MSKKTTHITLRKGNQVNKYTQGYKPQAQTNIDDVINNVVNKIFLYGFAILGSLVVASQIHKYIERAF